MNKQAKGLAAYRMHFSAVTFSVLFGAVFLATALAAFHQPTPHGVVVGLVGQPSVTRQIRLAVADRMPGAFDLRVLPLEPAARAAIAQRRLDGAVVLTRSGMRVLTAQAGGTAPAGTIVSAFSAVGAKLHDPVQATDVVAPGSDDSQALSAYFLALCTLFPSLVLGVAAGHALRRGRALPRVAVLILGSMAGGSAVAAIGGAISGLGHFWQLAGIVALFSLAISAPTAALTRIRPQLVVLAVLVFLVLGIPASGGPANLTAFEPGFLRWLHPGLPLGIATDTIRNTVYFGGGDTAAHLWVLTAFAVAGLAVFGALGWLPRRRGAAAAVNRHQPRSVAHEAPNQSYATTA
jgi:hypothetical protein